MPTFHLLLNFIHRFTTQNMQLLFNICDASTLSLPQYQMPDRVVLMPVASGQRM